MIKLKEDWDRERYDMINMIWNQSNNLSNHLKDWINFSVDDFFEFDDEKLLFNSKSK